MALRLLLIMIFLAAIAAQAQTNSQVGLERKITQLEALASQKMAREQRALVKWMRTKAGPMPKVSERLLKTYYYLGTLHARLYSKYHSGEETAADLQNYRKALSYLRAAEAYEHNIDKVESHLERLEAIRLRRTKLQKKLHWRLSAQYLSYQELATLKDSAGEEDIYSPQRGYCLGGEVAYGNQFSEWALDACAFISTGNVGAKVPTRYFQQDVSSTGIYLKPTYWKLLSEGEAALGVGVPLLLRSVDYTDPAGGSVESRRALPFGVSVDGRWRMTGKAHFTTTAAMLDGSMLWGLGVLYSL